MRYLIIATLLSVVACTSKQTLRLQEQAVQACSEVDAAEAKGHATVAQVANAARVGCAYVKAEEVTEEP